MNMRKALPLLVIASMMLSMAPGVLAVSMSMNLSATVGFVGDTVTVTGTIVTFNGPYNIVFDPDKTGSAAGPGTVVVGTGTASGYAISKDIVIPDAWGGADQIFLIDTTAGIPQAASAFYTVQTKYALTSNVDSIVEGDPVTATGTITGAPYSWGFSSAPGVQPPVAAVNAPMLRVRAKDPSSTLAETLTSAGLVAAASGKYTYAAAFPIVATVWTKDGTWNLFLDYSVDAGVTWTVDKATKSVVVGITDKAVYGRTQTVNGRIYNTAAVAITAAELVAPDGTVTVLGGTPIAPATWWAIPPAYMTVLTTLKTTTTGIYTLRFKDASANVIKSATFTLNPSGINFGVPTMWQMGWSIPAAGSAAIGPALTDVERMMTITAQWPVTYDDLATSVTSIDLGSGFTVSVVYNGTVVTTTSVTSISGFTAPNLWKATWTVPKDAVLGKNYMFNITALTITDAYGNSGPAKMYSTKSAGLVNIVKGQMFVTSAPTNIFPGAVQIPRTNTAKASFEVKYRNGDRLTGAEFAQGNFTVYAGAAVYKANVALAAADYSAETGLWIAKYKIPYNIPIGPGTTYGIGVGDAANRKILDVNGNRLELTAYAPAVPTQFTPVVAPITISNVAVDTSSVQTDEQVTITFTATYPSGDPVTTKAAGFPVVNIIDSGGAITYKVASYDTATQMWKVAYIIPAGSVSGIWNATVAVYSAVAPLQGIADDAATPNTGPTTKKYANFDVTRVSLTDVLAAADAAKAAADLASTKADAAKTAADTASTKADAAAAAATSAGTKADAAAAAATASGTAATAAKTSADAAKTSADAAGTKADAATAAANAAKTSADSAASAANNLTTLVYGAIGASLVAALAAIVCLMQVSRKIA